MKLIKLKSLELPKFKKYEHTTEQELRKWCGENPPIPKVGMIVAGKTEKTMSRGGIGYATMKKQEYTDDTPPIWEEYNCSLGLGWARDKYLLVK